MLKLLNNLRLFRSRFQKNKIVLIQARNIKIENPIQIRFQPHTKITPFAWFLLIIPGSTFCLGTWQLQRKKWKENLISKLQTRINKDPVKLPENLEEISKLEYCPIHVKGRFLHDKEIYLGPRSLIKDGDAATKSSLISGGRGAANGYLVITPFKLANREETILVNRGWVPHKHKDPSKRAAAQVDEDVDVIGIVRKHEPRPVFMPANNKNTNCFLYRDLNQMCEMTGADPIFVDATDEFDIPGGPVGSQTRVTLRNEHLSYILTWYTLSAASGLMWYMNFIKRIQI